jgi:hypothetical protein
MQPRSGLRYCDVVLLSGVRQIGFLSVPKRTDRSMSGLKRVNYRDSAWAGKLHPIPQMGVSSDRVGSVRMGAENGCLKIATENKARGVIIRRKNPTGT